MIGVTGVLALLLAGVTLEGAVVNESMRSIPNVYVTVKNEDGQVLVRQPLLTSRVRMDIPGDPRTLSCVVEAKEYTPRNVTVEVIDGRAALGTLVMKRMPGLRLSRLYVGRDDKRQWVDVVVTNEAEVPAVIESLALRASNDAETGTCLDLVTPDVTVDLGDIAVTEADDAPQRPGLATITAGAKTIQTASRAKVSSLKCQRIRLTVETTLVYRVAPRETHKLRLVVPLEARSPERVIPIDLGSWHLKKVTLRQDDGREYESQ